MLYHKNLGFPKTLNLLDSYNLNVKYSNHALQACTNDVNGVINVNELNTIHFQRKQIIEVETTNNKNTEKVLVRVGYDNQYDLLLAISLIDNTVKTVWLNKKSDNHSTLNSAKYDRPNNQQKINIRF